MCGRTKVRAEFRWGNKKEESHLQDSGVENRVIQNES
jgi:hypothetical protein